MQLFIATCCILMANIHIQQQLYFVALLGLIIAICSATQDIAIDGYRIDIIPTDDKDNLSAASAAATAGWWTGYGGLGAIPFFIADIPGWSWSHSYYVLAGIMLLLGVPVLMASEPDIDRSKLLKKAEDFYHSTIDSALPTKTYQKIATWFLITLIEPFREFYSYLARSTSFSFCLLASISFFLSASSSST